MRRAIVAFAWGVAVLATWGSTIAADQGLSPEVKAQLCSEKKAGLAKFEAEAPGLHAQVAKLESEYAAASQAETDAITRMNTRVQTPSGGIVEGLIDVGAFKLVEAARTRREAVAKQLASAKERERYVGNQVFLLRDIIQGLGCDTPTPAPMDYRAIDQHTQQFQQSGPGGMSGTSGQSAQPQSSTYTAPSTGFGSSSGSTQPAGQQGQQPGYGPGPYDTGSFKPPKHGEIQETIQGSIGEKPGMSKPGGG